MTNDTSTDLNAYPVKDPSNGSVAQLGKSSTVLRGGAPYPCSFCPAHFSTFEQCDQHMNEMHQRELLSLVSRFAAALDKPGLSGAKRQLHPNPTIPNTESSPGRITVGMNIGYLYLNFTEAQSMRMIDIPADYAPLENVFGIKPFRFTGVFVKKAK